MSPQKTLCAALLCAFLHPVWGQTKRQVRASDLPRSWTSSEAAFDRILAGISQRARERLRDGENDHLVAYILQSSQFTNQPTIEPARSALEFVNTMDAEVRGRYLAGGDAPFARAPENVVRRIDAFLQARAGPGADERLPYFQSIVAGRGKSYLVEAYARTMRFLYRKESAQQQGRPPTDLYRERGYALDTQVEANYAVWSGLAVLKSLEPKLAIRRVLIVGPGLDISPRTGLVDIFPPQSYQPFAVVDALLSLRLASAEGLRVHCVDVNPLVIRFFEEFPRRGRKTLNLISGLPAERLSSDFLEYFQNLGRKIGEEVPLSLPKALASHLAKSLTVRDEVARSITAADLNVLAERYDPSPAYDLVVVTNVLIYFSRQELALALANIHSMIRPGGYLLHNELRPEVEALGRELALPPVQARTIELSSDGQKPLLDSAVLQIRR